MLLMRAVAIRLFIIAFFTLLIALPWGIVGAVESSAQNERSALSPPASETEIDRLEKENLELRQQIDRLLDKLASSQSADQQLETERKRFYFLHERRVFWWQLLVSYLLSAIVLGMVLFGVWLSWLQFRRANLLHPDTSAKTLTTDMEISTEKVRIRTSLVGVLILCLAFGFTVAFLVGVYEISVIVPSTGR